ncbi:SIR2 family protein [Nguyenibacter sp. L1]|uniref:SIR2 family protein n=1 Tax=Nguyenibacter sp. L1 TaxID=3049350 RepID=UPI002B49EB2E|nr:hypothetical protein [Nguyenibacter sp. L1]WRH86339.1 SIR2 family protein [Nguyenibacter sp. L1]
MEKSITRPRVLVILGAGSTLHANAPSTQDIDDLIFKMEDSTISSVVRLLKEQRTARHFNFEAVLAALEELDEFSRRKKYPTNLANKGGYLAAFTDWMPDFTSSGDAPFTELRLQLIGKIKNFVIERTHSSSPERLKSFFDNLRAYFDLTVVTLNYDDLIDRSGEWYDGFVPAQHNHNGEFDYDGFPQRSMQESTVLLHLHGSVRFTFPPFSPVPSPKGEIVRSSSAKYGLPVTLHPSQGIEQPSPIIAGGGKDRWMTRACVPFGYYYNAFINTAQLCSRVIVAGYGGGDEHVNSWLVEHSRLHGDRRRVVNINPIASEQPDACGHMTLRGNDGRFPPNDSDTVRKIIDFLNRT